MKIEVLRPVLIGSRIHHPGDTLDVEPATGKRLSQGSDPLVKILVDESLPMLTRQSLQQSIGATATDSSGAENGPPLNLESLVALGVPPKVAKVLIEAGIKDRRELTMDHLIEIGGIGKQTAEMVVALATKPE